VVAGTFAQVVQRGRDLLGDTSPGHREGLVNGRLEGILAEGEPRPCDAALLACPLEDGVLTRAEAQALVFGNVLPSSVRPPTGVRNTQLNLVYDEYLTTPSSAFTYTNQGHGIVRGHSEPGRFPAEQRRFLDALRGAVGPLPRPPGEANWMFADSKCRQKLWGGWSGGYYTDGAPDPTWDPATDQLAMAWNAACTPLPMGTLAHPSVEFSPLPEDICAPVAIDPLPCLHHEWTALQQLEDGINHRLRDLDKLPLPEPTT
jgi:hypothetical protein